MPMTTRFTGSPVPLPSAVTCRYLVETMLRVESQRSSSLIDINVYSQDPRLGADIANEIARTYSADRIAVATSDQSEGLAQLRKELAAQEAVVSRQRDAVEKLRKDLNISGVDLNARYSDMEIETLRQMQNTLIALSVDAIGRKTRWERFRSIAPAERVSLVNSELIPDQNIQNLLQAYLVADQKVTQLKSRLGEAHPDLVAATVMVKRAAALTNRSLGRLHSEVADAIVTAADDVLGGALLDQFVVELALDRTDRHVLPVGALVGAVEVGAGVEDVGAPLLVPRTRGVEPVDGGHQRRQCPREAGQGAGAC